MGAQAVRLSNVDIDKALENKDFEVLFQPIFDLGNGALARMETFVRWRHPSLGVLPPGAFISFFETQGRMSELTRYVLAEALTGYTNWRGPFAPGLSINLALTDLADEAFASHFKKLVRDREFPADLVTLECPMPPVDADMKAAAENFVRLRSTGARLAIEVRGRANDFLRSIDPFPFDEIKTGGASILRFARTVRGPGLTAISDLLDIANKANAVITAVGVEDQASLAALRGLGFTAAQGNHLGKVGDLKEFRPGRVNEVRQLLDLPALSSDDLTSLFRTEAPTPKAAETETTESVDQEDGLVERLNERVSAQTHLAPEVEAEVVEPEVKKSETEGDAKRANAREKAKALALAKRTKAREIRKAAAIKRAKAKAALAQKQETDETAENTAPRALQDRLAQEFNNPQKQADASGADSQQPAVSPAPVEKAIAPATAAPQATPAAPQATPDTPQPNATAEHPPIQDAPKTQPSSLVERAVAASDAGDLQATQLPEPKPDGKMGMKIAAAGAHFWPGVRVAGPALNARLKPLSQKILDKLAGGEPAPVPQQAASSPETTTRPLDNAIVQGDLQKEYVAELEAPTLSPVKPRKNFLSRKYKVMPTHFWPKNWKRKYRQWRAMRDNEAQADQQQA